MAHDNNPDWAAIRAEYIGGGISYRDLAKKHGVSVTTLSVRASQEGWAQDRAEAAETTRALAVQRTADMAAENSVKLEYAKSLMIDKVIKSLEHMPEVVGSHIRQSTTDRKNGRQMVVDYDVLKLVVALERLSAYSDAEAANRIVKIEEDAAAEEEQ